MICTEVTPQLQALLDGALTPEAAAGIEAHLAGCTTCSEARDELRAVLEMARAWHVEGTAVLAAVQQRINEDELRSLQIEMRRLRAEVVSLHAEVAELKSQAKKRDARAGWQSSVSRFPYSTVHDVPRPIL